MNDIYKSKVKAMLTAVASLIFIEMAVFMCASCNLADPFNAPLPPTRTPVPKLPIVQVTLEQAKSRAPYQVLLPDYLPNQAKLANVQQQDYEELIDGALRRYTILSYQGIGTAFTITEVQTYADPIISVQPVAPEVSGPRAMVTPEYKEVYEGDLRKDTWMMVYTYNLASDVESLLLMIHKSNVRVIIDGMLTQSEVIKIAQSLK